MKPMLGLSRLCGALLGVIAICAIATASASAAMPEFAGPFANKFTFTSKSVLLELETKAGKMECGEAVGNGEVVAAKELRSLKSHTTNARARSENAKHWGRLRELW